jgi:hypothetical protein
MDEFQIKVLEANGYSYKDGGIIDADGNYLPSVVLNGKTLKSESDFELWNRGQKLDKKYSSKTDIILKKDYSTIYDEMEEEENQISNKNEETQTSNTLEVESNFKIFKEGVYKFPLVLGLSIIIFLIIKRITK